MEEKTKKKSGTKTAIIVIVVLLIAIILGYFAFVKYQQNQVEKKVKEMFSSLSSGNGQEREEYLGEMINKTEDNQEEYYNALLEKLTYDIKNVTGNAKNATVSVEVSNKNMGVVLTNYLAKAIQLSFATAFSPTQNSEEDMDKQMAEFLEEQINSDEIETVTTAVNINLEKDNGEWTLTEESKKDLIDAVLPGIADVKEKLESLENN